MEGITREVFISTLGTAILCLSLIVTLLRLFLSTQKSNFIAGSIVMSLSIGIILFLLRAQHLEVHSELEVFLLLLEVIGGSCFLLFLYLLSRTREVSP